MSMGLDLEDMSAVQYSERLSAAIQETFTDTLRMRGILDQGKIEAHYSAYHKKIGLTIKIYNHHFAVNMSVDNFDSGEYIGIIDKAIEETEEINKIGDIIAVL